jgi:hypothetical protein
LKILEYSWDTLLRVNFRLLIAIKLFMVYNHNNMLYKLTWCFIKYFSVCKFNLPQISPEQYKFFTSQKRKPVMSLCLTSVILATCEAGISRITVGSLSGQNVYETPVSTSSWVWWCVPVIPNYVGRWDLEDHGSRPTWAKKFSISVDTSWAWCCMPVISVTAGSIK